MPKSHSRYAPENRRRMVELVRAGRCPDDLAKEFEPTAPRSFGIVRSDVPIFQILYRTAS